MSWLRKQGRIYHLQYRDANGSIVSQSLRTDDKATAEDFRRRFDYTKSRKRLGLPLNKTTWQDFKRDYLIYSRTNKRQETVKIDERSLGLFESMGSPDMLADVTTQQIETWKKHRLAKVEAGTVNIELTALKAAFAYAQKHGIIDSDPALNVPKIRLEKKFPKFLNKDQIKLVIKEAYRSGPDLGLMAKVFIYAGLRLREAVHLRWEDIDTFQGWLYVKGWGGWTPKDHEERGVPLHAELIKDFKKFSRREGLVFPGKIDIRNIHAIDRRFNLIFKRCGLDFTGVHVLRHTFGSLMAMSGVPVRTLQKWMGHSSIQTTMIYLHITDSHSKEAMKKASRS